jgi:hypothetical protein
MKFNLNSKTGPENVNNNVSTLKKYFLLEIKKIEPNHFKTKKN